MHIENWFGATLIVVGAIACTVESGSDRDDASDDTSHADDQDTSGAAGDSDVSDAGGGGTSDRGDDDSSEEPADGSGAGRGSSDGSAGSSDAGDAGDAGATDSVSGVGGSAGGETSGEAGAAGEGATLVGDGEAGAAGTGIAAAGAENNGDDGSDELQSVIESTATGGLWHDPATWVGGVVPTAADEAEVHGEVRVDLSEAGDPATCRNLILGVGSVLRAEPYQTRKVVVRGDLRNQGSVRNGPDYASYDTATLEVELAGDFFQGGSYGVSATRFIGEGPQNISVAAGATWNGSFTDEDPSSPLVAASPIAASSLSLALGSAEAGRGALEMAGNTLTLAGGDTRITEGVLHAGRILGVEGATLTCAEIIGDGAPVVLEGDIRVAAPTAENLITIDGDVHVLPEAAFYNQSYSEPTVRISGTLTNEGVVRWGPGYAAYGAGALSIELGGDLNQDGSYTPTATSLVGVTRQIVSVGADQVLTGAFVDAVPASAVEAGSAIVASSLSFDLGGEAAGRGTLDMGDNSLSLAEGTVSVVNGSLHASHIVGIAGAILTCDAIVASADPIVLEGDIRIASPREDQALALDGNVLLKAESALYNQSYTDPIVQISGSLTNEGVVRSGPGYAAYGSNSLTVELGGDLAQNGSYTPLATYFVGSSAQTVSVGIDNVLTGTFIDTTPSSSLVAGGDLTIQDASIDLGVDAESPGALEMGEYVLRHTDGALTIAGGSLAVDTIIGRSDDNGGAIFAIATVEPPSGTLTITGRFPTASMDVVGALALPSGSVMYNAYNVEAHVTVSGTVSGAGIAGSGQGYASYDNGSLFLNGVELENW